MPGMLLMVLLVYGVPGYFNSLVLIPRLLKRHKYAAYIVSLNLLLAIATVASYTATQWLNSEYPQLQYMGSMRHAYLPYHLVPASAMLAMLAFGKFALDSNENDRKLNELEKQHLADELAGLRNQINPHFLFNALNTIYGLSLKNDPKTPEAVIHLSDILRYGLYEVTEKDTTLEREIRFMEQFVAFARLRMCRGDSIQLHIDAPNAADLQITPLLFAPFVENAIKHGRNDEDIDIHLSTHNHSICFSCRNSFDPRPVLPETEGKRVGIGVRNVRRRLELLYPGKYELNINDANGKFLVELNLQLP
jgi:LytS/YehU family sensor histidine kinase